MKIKLTTVILSIIIMVLTISLIIVYYFGFIKNTPKEVKISSQNVMDNDQNSTPNINITENKEFGLLTANELITKIGTNINKDYLTNNFCIDNIEETNDGYIITAFLLSKEAKAISNETLQTIKSGGEIEFRNKKWKMDEKFSDDNYIRIKSDQKQLSIDLKNMYIRNVAGIYDSIRDYSGEKIKFKVNKNIPICTWEFYFMYDSNGVIHQYTHFSENEDMPLKSYNVEYLKNILKIASGSYEECSLYIKNGSIDAIKIYYK